MLIKTFKKTLLSQCTLEISRFGNRIYKHICGLSPAIMGGVFKINRNLSCKLRTHNEFSCRVPKTIKYGTETISFLAPNVWALVQSSCLEAFKSRIKK